jgi:large subunit ribosomal protein L21
MYAIFEDGSRQYRVSEGEVVRVDYRETPVGDRVEFPRVLLYAKDGDVKIGLPTIDGMRVLGTVVGQPSTKIYVQHFRRRKNYKRLKGHRQHYLEIKVTNILMPGEATPPAPVPAPAAAPEAPEAPAATEQSAAPAS